MKICVVAVVACAAYGVVLAEDRIQTNRNRFDQVDASLSAKDLEPSERVAALRMLVELDARRSVGSLKRHLADPAPGVQRFAAEHLTLMKVPEGRDFEATLLDAPSFADRAVAVRMLGVYGGTVHAGRVAEEVRKVRATSPAPGTSEASLLDYSLLTLARMGRPEDAELVVTTASSSPEKRLPSNESIEALGLVRGPASEAALHAVLKRIEPLDDPAARSARTVALLALSRLGNVEARRQVEDRLRDRSARGQERAADTLERLRHRDMEWFGNALLEVAAAEPENGVTRAAWEALGRAHPEWLAEKALRLALSRKPHWKEVSRHTLNCAVIAMDPRLNRRFWNGLGVSPVPEMLPERSMVESGLGFMLFRGTWGWTGD